MLRFANLISGGATTCQRIFQEEALGGRLHGVSKTALVVASSYDVSGIKNMISIGFPKENIHVAEPGPKFAAELLGLLDAYNVGGFHQLGWMPQMPKEVIAQYTGLNQHFGPGGKWMYGVRRVYVHMRFCQEVGRIIPVEVFCQLVDSEYDAGRVVCNEIVDLDFRKTPEDNAKALLLIEHEVQIKGRQCMFFGITPDDLEFPINIAQNPEEESLLLALKKEARDKYPPEK